MKTFVDLAKGAEEKDVVYVNMTIDWHKTDKQLLHEFSVLLEGAKAKKERQVKEALK
jgi:hypothetical protein